MPAFVEILWWVFAAITVAGGIGMVLLRNPVGSLLSLVLSFFGLAAIYLLLGAHFVAVIQVLLYAGAVMVLFLFTIMLLNLGHDYRGDLRSVAWIFVGGVLSGVLGWALARIFWTDGLSAVPGQGAAIEAAVRDQGAVGAIAYPLFRDFLVPFELTSILLLAAIVGAVLLAKRRI
jgi:NADH-quinone oxidoreductase subunit J